PTPTPFPYTTLFRSRARQWFDLADRNRQIRGQGRNRSQLEKPTRRLLLYRMRTLHIGVSCQPYGKTPLAQKNYDGYQRPPGRTRGKYPNKWERFKRRWQELVGRLYSRGRNISLYHL